MELIKYLTIIHNNKLTNTEQMILKNLENYINIIPNLTISELSEIVYSSPTSLHRLVKKLGFDGYTEFKYVIENELHAHEEKLDFTQTNTYLSDVIDDIKITYKLNENKFDTVVREILSKDDIYCFGTGWKQKKIVDNFANDLLYYGHSVKTLR